MFAVILIPRLSDGEPINRRLDESGGFLVGQPLPRPFEPSKNGLKRSIRAQLAWFRKHLYAVAGNLPTCPGRAQHKLIRPALFEPARDARRTARAGLGKGREPAVHRGTPCQPGLDVRLGLRVQAERAWRRVSIRRSKSEIG